MHISIVILFCLAFFLMIMSSFLSASETAFFSLDELKIRHFKPNDIKIIKRLFKNATLVLSSILIVNTSTNILLTTVLELFFKVLGFEFNLIESTLILSGLIIIFGEILPKSFAASQEQVLVPIIIKPLRNITHILKRIAYPINKLAKWLTDKFIDFLPEQENKEDRRAALYNIVARGEFLKNEEKVLIGRVLSLAERKVGAVMTPRPRIFSVSEDTTLIELKNSFLSEQHSKIPVYKDKDSNVIGVLYYEDIALQIIKNINLNQKVSEFMKQIYFVPESKTLGSLLENFRERSIKIAGVVDEYGDFLGIVTLSDIMAELVGEVVDEDFDKDQDIIPQLHNRYIVKGEISLIDFNEEFNTEFLSTDYETIAGFLIEKAGGIPPLYYTFETESIVITVREKSATRIKTLSVRVKS